MVRTAWEEQMAARRASLDFEIELTNAGESWSAADDDGNLVVRHADT